VAAGHQKVDCLPKEDVVGWQRAQGGENVDRVKVISVDNEPAGSWRSVTCVEEGAQYTESFEIEDEVGAIVDRRR
jgi:hypothetical protein